MAGTTSGTRPSPCCRRSPGTDSTISNTVSGISIISSTTSMRTPEEGYPPPPFNSPSGWHHSTRTETVHRSIPPCRPTTHCAQTRPATPTSPPPAKHINITVSVYRHANQLVNSFIFCSGTSPVRRARAPHTPKIPEDEQPLNTPTLASKQVSSMPPKAQTRDLFRLITGPTWTNQAAPQLLTHSDHRLQVGHMHYSSESDCPTPLHRRYRP